MKLLCDKHSFIENLFYFPDNPHCSSNHLYDEWTIVHFINGMLFKLLFPYITIFQLFLIHTLFEIYENTSLGKKLVNYTSNYLYSGDSLLNSISDTIVFVLGGYIVEKNKILSYKNNNYISIFIIILLNIYIMYYDKVKYKK
jgi:hypothetical protein